MLEFRHSDGKWSAEGCSRGKRIQYLGSVLCVPVYRTPAQQAGMLPWHWPRHEGRGYRIITVVLAKHKNGSLKMVPMWTETCRNDRRNFCFNIPVILCLCASLWNNKSALTLWMYPKKINCTPIRLAARTGMLYLSELSVIAILRNKKCST
jgi:hypothetical protein